MATATPTTLPLYMMALCVNLRLLWEMDNCSALNDFRPFESAVFCQYSALLLYQHFKAISAMSISASLTAALTCASVLVDTLSMPTCNLLCQAGAVSVGRPVIM